MAKADKQLNMSELSELDISHLDGYHRQKLLSYQELKKKEEVVKEIDSDTEIEFNSADIDDMFKWVCCYCERRAIDWLYLENQYAGASVVAMFDRDLSMWIRCDMCYATAHMLCMLNHFGISKPLRAVDLNKHGHIKGCVDKVPCEKGALFRGENLQAYINSMRIDTDDKIDALVKQIQGTVNICEKREEIIVVENSKGNNFLAEEKVKIPQQVSQSTQTETMCMSFHWSLLEEFAKNADC